MTETRWRAAPATRQPGALLRPVLMITLGGALPLALAPQPRPSLAFTLLLAVTIYIGAQLGWVMMSPTPKLARFFGLLFFYLFLGLAPLEQFSRNSFPLPSGVNPSDAQTAVTIIFVTVLVAEFSYFMTLRRYAYRGPAEPRRTVSAARVKMLGLFAVVAMLYEVNRIGGLGVMLSSRAQFNTAFSGSVSGVVVTSSQAINSALLTTPILIAAYLLTACTRMGLLRRGRVLIGLIILAAIFARNPIVSARYAFGVAIVSLAIAIAWPLQTRVYRSIAVFSALGVTVFFSIFNAFRYANPSGGRTSNIVSNPASSLTHGDYDAFQQLVNTVSYTKANGNTDGRQLLSEVLFFVPRRILSSRSTDSGVLVAKNLGYQFTNLSCPLPAEAYLDFSWAGVCVYAGVLGCLWAALDRAITASALQASWLGLVAPIIAVTQFIILRGSLLQTVGGTAVTIALVFACTKPVRKPEPT